jgi:hypothetical protein
MRRDGVMFCLFLQHGGFQCCRCETFVRFASTCSKKASSGIQLGSRNKVWERNDDGKESG